MRAALAALVLLGCSSASVAPRDCTPGQVVSCPCPGSAAAVQICGTDGTLGACMCTDAGGPGSGARDVAPQEDRAPLADTVAVVDAGGLDAADVQPGPDVVDASSPDAGTADALVCNDASTCSGRCVDLSTDPANCGACRNLCPPGRAHTRPVCFASACTTSCEEGWRNCDRNDANGCEVNSLADPQNCGTCGTACPLGETCMAGVCRRR